MNALDYVVLIGSMLGIALYGMWKTRGRGDLETYLKGARHTPWYVIGLSVMATQASAITFMSTPGQGFASGTRFVQFYFGLPIALIIISAVFLPMYRRLNVYTAYEYLGRRFDTKTRLLGAVLFLVQRGLGAGITIYAPAIILATVLGWSLSATIALTGLVVVIYTVSGGSEAVNLTQKWQMAIVFGGLFTAFFVLVSKLPPDVSFTDAVTVAGGMGRLDSVDYSVNLNERYTFWSGLLGGLFLQLSYFGTDQSQVQRYISGTSLRQSRLGLMFNALLKIPMQFFILFLGTMVFVFYQFAPQPVLFNQTVWRIEMDKGDRARLELIEQEYNSVHEQKQQAIGAWLNARKSGSDGAAEAEARVQQLQQRSAELRQQAIAAVADRSKANDNDYVFIRFILDHLPHGIIGLLIAAFFAGALSSSSAELSALGSTTMVDIYRHVIDPAITDGQAVRASRWFTLLWGVIAVTFAFLARLTENLIQFVNMVGSIFYGVMLGLFVVAFFVPWIGGTALFISAIVVELVVIALYFLTDLGFLWLIPIGCGGCVILSVLLQVVLGPNSRQTETS